MDRAYSMMSIKSIDEEERVIEGIASTPTADRSGDVVEPLGGEFVTPLPLLWQHQHSQPIGHVEYAKATKDGIEFRARIAKTDEPGSLKSRLDEAWGCIKLKLVAAVSIGFKPLEYSYIEETGGIRFSKWSWLELSCVTIPANAEATISVVKSIDSKVRAATGRKDLDRSTVVPLPGDSGTTAHSRKSVDLKQPPSKGREVKTVLEQIAALEAARAAKAARMSEIMSKSIEDGRSTEADEAEEFDTMGTELKQLDADLGRLRMLEKMQQASATPLVPPAAASQSASAAASDYRGGQVISVKSNLPKGVEFARYVKALAMAKGNTSAAYEIAKANYPDQPRIATVLKAAVSAGTTTDPTWAGPLVEYQAFAGDFVDFLRPQTIIGKFGANGIPALFQVPFNVKIPGQTSGGSAAWVGEGAPKPLTKFDFSTVELRWAKVANIAVLTDELVRFSNPSADTLVRNALAAAIIERIDIDFVDPAKAAVANVSPASITNGITPVASHGSTAADIRADVAAVFGKFIQARMSPTSGVWIMGSTTALALSQYRNALGQQEFNGVSLNGGTFEGLPVIVSDYVPAGAGGSPTVGSLLILANASDIYLADDGQVVVDASREASLQMDSAPSNHSGTPTAATMVSMFQTNSIAIRAERFINWQRRRAAAVAYVSNVAYAAS